MIQLWRAFLLSDPIPIQILYGVCRRWHPVPNTAECCSTNSLRPPSAFFVGVLQLPPLSL